MKKQILILVVFLLAAFANVNKSYGQTCTPDALNPAPGVPYDYEVTISGTTGATVPTYAWSVTQALNLITGATISAGTDYVINSGAGTSKINITWTSAALANGNPYYLVVRYNETSSTGCVVQNMRVYKIKPINTFLLAIAGSDATGDITKASTCPPAIDGALISGEPNPIVTYTYGQTAIYYKATASGVNGTWTPSISLPALAGLGQNYNSADWTDDNGTSWNTFGVTDGDLDGGNFTSTATDAPATVAGSPIIIRVLIDNVNYESLAQQAITIGVDGVLPGGKKDIKTVADCTDEADFGKTGTHTVQPRPAVNDAIPNTPAATDFITKNP